MRLGRPAGRQGRPMKQKTIDFRELLERLLPLDELPPASRFEVHRALQTGVVTQLERAAFLALSQLEQGGALKRLPPAGNGGGPVLRYQTRNALDVISIELPATRPRHGILEFARAGLPAHARADIGPIRRLLALDDSLVSDPGRARPGLIAQIGLVGHELLASGDVMFVPAGASVFEAGTGAEPFDPALAAEALGAPRGVLYCPDLAQAPSLAAEGKRRGVRALALAAAVAADGRALGHLEARSPDPDPYRPEDLALIALLAETVAGLIERAARIEKLVFVDGLTGVYNRAYFDQQVEVEMARAQREQSSMALCIADIDDFKSFNTAYGYEAGNQVLVQVAQALKHAVRPFDIVARWGGEEFAVLLTAPMSSDDAATISERLRATVERQLVRLEGLDRQSHHVGVRVSVGVALFPDHAGQAHELWRAANQALLAAKRPPKNRVVFFGA
jgi:diguanylate cyclase (GGDEF)-like protein